ncbi:hypothetical protein GC176_06605 [bacterium]|nr:hypothetical protein [bacterium]
MPSRLLTGLAAFVVLSAQVVRSVTVAADEAAVNRRATLPPVVALAVEFDGEGVVSASQAGLSPLSLRTEIVNPHAVAFAPDGRSVLVCGGEPGQTGRIEIFGWPVSDHVTGTARQSFQVGGDSLYAAAWSPDGGLIAVAGLDGFGRVLDVATGHERTRLSGHSRGLTGIGFLSPQWLVTAGLDGSVRLWNATSGELQRTLANHSGAVTGLTIGPPREPAQLRLAASFGDDRTVRLWQPGIGRLVRFVRLPSKPLAVIWLSENVQATEHGELLAVACRDGQVRIVSVDTAEILVERPVIDGPAYCIAAQDAAKRLVVAGHHGQIASVRLTDLLKKPDARN